MGKDFIYLYGKDHHPLIWILFCKTIIIPFIVNVWSANVIQYRRNKPRNPDDAMPQPIDEVKLLMKTLWIHLGFEMNDGEADGQHTDFPEQRYRATKNIKLIENILQMCLILFETFQDDDTVTFIAMFNFMFGLLTSTLTFSEHVGHRFAAKHPYVFADEVAINAQGLTTLE